MTTDQTPPNDTQAPVWPQGGYAPGSYWCKCVSCNQQFTGDKRAYQCPDCTIQALASHSAAREAAAAQAMREAAKKIAAAAGLELKNEHGRDEGISWGYVTMVRIDALPIPADGQAALDRLIAERVREAVEAEREACAKVAEHPATPGIAAAIRARASKEGQS